MVKRCYIRSMVCGHLTIMESSHHSPRTGRSQSNSWPWLPSIISIHSYPLFLYILFISPYNKHIWSLWSWVKIMISFGSHLKIAGIYESSSPYDLVLPGITISLTHPGYTTGRSPMASWHPGQALDEMPRRDGVHQRSIVRQNAIQEQRVHPGALDGGENDLKRIGQLWWGIVYICMYIYIYLNIDNMCNKCVYTVYRYK